MDYDAWVVDMAKGTVTHETGVILHFEGNPDDPTSVNPRNFPSGMPFLEQARLTRCGLEFLAKSAQDSNFVTSSKGKTAVVMDIESLKSDAAREREALAKKFAERADKPQRSVLSLKKKSD